MYIGEGGNGFTNKLLTFILQRPAPEETLTLSFALVPSYPLSEL